MVVVKGKKELLTLTIKKNKNEFTFKTFLKS
jgi:hypothetical protein